MNKPSPSADEVLFPQRQSNETPVYSLIYFHRSIVVIGRCERGWLDPVGTENSTLRDGWIG